MKNFVKRESIRFISRVIFVLSAIFIGGAITYFVVPQGTSPATIEWLFVGITSGLIVIYLIFVERKIIKRFTKTDG